MLIPVVLCGGSGTRLWPLSRKSYPKQLLSLLGENSLLQETALRAQHIDNATAPLILANQEHRFLIAEQLRQIELTPEAIILEPEGKNTAPAAAIAALWACTQHGDATLCIMPADHFIADQKKFSAAIKTAAQSAERGHLVTFGIHATRPETGYGYIHCDPSDKEKSKKIIAFIEKPEKNRAQQFVDAGSYYWNSGMFVFKASCYIEALQQHAPDILKHCQTSFENRLKDLDFVRLDDTAFNACPNISIDYAVMENIDNGMMVPLETTWSDIGSWSALFDALPKDQNNNVNVGGALTEDTSNCYLHTEGPLLATLGVTDIVAIACHDAVLVAHKDAAQDVKKIVAQLKKNKTKQAFTHHKVYRPWGFYEVLHAGQQCIVKHLCINPNKRLSLQSHAHRAEHWTVLSGTPTVIKDKDRLTLQPNQSIDIPIGCRHRLINETNTSAHIIEVQSGEILSEDDITRYSDDFGRLATEWALQK